MSCTGTNAQFVSRATCISAALSFPEADVAPAWLAQSGDNSDCRLYHAGVAGTSVANAAIHCPHVSVNGGGVCGADPCHSYCNLVQYNCFNATTTFNLQYPSWDACFTACSGFPQLTNMPLITANNSLDCRVYHAQVAGTSVANAVAHCPHTGISGGYGVCGTAIEGFCQVVQAVCTGANSQYASTAACMAAAANFSTAGTVGDATGNTMQCRITQLALAAKSSADATMRCPWISAAPTGMCNTTVTATTSSSTGSTMISSTGTISSGAASTASSISFIVLVVAAIVTFVATL